MELNLVRQSPMAFHRPDFEPVPSNVVHSQQVERTKLGEQVISIRLLTTGLSLYGVEAHVSCISAAAAFSTNDSSKGGKLALQREDLAPVKRDNIHL